MAATPNKYTVVKFKQLPIESMKDEQCVPTSWIKCYVDEVNVAVTFPTEMTATNKSLLKNGKEPIKKWEIFPATIVRQTNDNKKWNYELSLGVQASPAPQTPLEVPLANLQISEPSTSKGPIKPKILEKLFNTAETIDEENASTKTIIQVDEKLLKELHQTWQHLNSLMEKMFNKKS